jgi:hypothetical protein
MEFFEELLGGRHGRSRKHGHHDRETTLRGDRLFDHHGDRHHDRGEPGRIGAGLTDANSLLGRLLRNKTALVLLGLATALTLVVIVGALAFLLPMLMKLLGFVGENGLKSVVDEALRLLGNVWLGSGK